MHLTIFDTKSLTSKKEREKKKERKKTTKDMFF